MQIDMLDPLPNWKLHFTKMYEWHDRYNAIWESLCAYHNLTQKTKSYEAVCQWNGKEMKEMSWYVVGVVTQSQQVGRTAHHPISNHAIECTRTVLEFYVYA
jgi:hypothetical protein